MIVLKGLGTDIDVLGVLAFAGLGREPLVTGAPAAVGERLLSLDVPPLVVTPDWNDRPQTVLYVGLLKQVESERIVLSPAHAADVLIDGASEPIMLDSNLDITVDDPDKLLILEPGTMFIVLDPGDMTVDA